MHKTIGIIVLAAGASRRMGKPKQLLKFQGETLIRRMGRIAENTNCRPIIVVLGANADRINVELDWPGVEVVRNEQWQQGMGSSVKEGINKLLEVAPTANAAVFLLVDQPLVNHEHIQKLIEVYEKKRRPIVASAYKQTVGVPALFDRVFFDQLKSIRADRGARFLIKQAGNQVEAVPFPDGALDIDRMEDWEQFKAKYE